VKRTALLLVLALVACDKVKDPVGPNYAAATPTPTPAVEALVTATFLDATTGATVPYAKLHGIRTEGIPLAWWTLYAGPSGVGTWYLPFGTWDWTASAPDYVDQKITMVVSPSRTTFTYRMEARR
jgi:hypothetical protein